MDSEEYEIEVAEHFKLKGYKVSITQRTNDYGVDVFAEKETEKIAIQAKKYGGTSRSVNREVIMNLHGAKDYFDCTRAILVTNVSVLPNAQEVATKLNVEILILDFDRSASKRSYRSTLFDSIWEEHIKPLKGQTILRKDGKANKIVEVDSSGVTRLTSNGRKQKIDIEIFRNTINHIFQNGRITRDEINQEYAKRASSGIVLILSQLPMFELSERPLTLRLKK